MPFVTAFQKARSPNLYESLDRTPTASLMHWKIANSGSCSLAKESDCRRSNGTMIEELGTRRKRLQVQEVRFATGCFHQRPSCLPDDAKFQSVTNYEGDSNELHRKQNTDHRKTSKCHSGTQGEDNSQSRRRYTAQLSRMYNGRSVRFILQEVEALREKRLRDGQRRVGAI